MRWYDIYVVSASLVPRWERFFNNNTVTNVTSLLAGFYLLSGPLASALANSFGCNTVAVAGAFVAAIGFLVSALIPALPVLYVAFGIIGGIGFGLVFLPAIVIVGQYFSEKRALATGIAVCGSGIGTAIFGQINPIILDHFDKLVGEEDSWRIFLLFLSAITLFCAIFGCFFKPLKPSKSQLEQVVKIASEFMGKGGNNEEIILREENEENNKIIRRPSDTTKITQGVEIERFVKPPQNGALSRRRLDSFSQRPFLSTLELLASRHALDQSSTSNANLARKVSKVGVIDLNRPLSRMDVFYTGSTQSLAKRTQNRMPNFSENNFFENKQEAKPSIGKSNLYLSAAGLHTLEGAAKSGIVSSKWTNNIISSLRSMLDLGLLQSPTFLVLAISGFLTLFCFFVPFAFIGELAANKISSTTTTTNNFNKNETNNLNNSESGSASQLLLVLLGLFNVVGRVLCGIVDIFRISMEKI
uniref:Major facilitator superfamily (MFS) profile domain-containing protein n=1 Tax=Meloidogyne javanica TaxID=6303 RepID=A0A915MNK2_MELJA